MKLLLSVNLNYNIYLVRWKYRFLWNGESCFSKYYTYDKKLPSAATVLWPLNDFCCLYTCSNSNWTKKKKKITEFPIVSFVNALMSTLFDEIKASVNDIPTCVVHFKILFVWYIVVSDNWTGTFRSSWLSNNGKFQGYANCGSSAQLFSLLSYQLSQFIVDKARLWEPPRAACTI